MISLTSNISEINSVPSRFALYPITASYPAGDIGNTLENLEYAFDNWGVGIATGSYTVGVDYRNEVNSACLVLYDTSELDDVFNWNDLIKYCNENGLDKENFEIDRVTLIKNDIFAI